MKDGLRVSIAQWLAIPGEVASNLETAEAMIRDAALSGIDLVMLPELWSMGYDPDHMARHAIEAAEPIDGPCVTALCALARELNIWIHGGTIPESANGLIYNTAILINRQGIVVATHRKFRPYSPTGEHLVFASGEGITVYEDEEVGRVGLVTCFDGDFRDTQAALRNERVELVLEPAAYDIPGASTWNLWYRANALASAQFWVMAGQCGVNPSASLLGASQIIAPTGELLAQGPVCNGLTTPEAALIFAQLTITDEIRAVVEYASLLDAPSPTRAHVVGS